ncbi:MAG: hypothetical protein LBN00_03615 [Oscillospiraceae bacterium]|jgi:hypothetical protein|nr:hypothetical protein [Oscillospiraceae bacterium]
MRKFSTPSNTDLVSGLFLELLADGCEHSTAEILKYVNEKAGGMGLDGKRLTDETVRGAIWQKLRYGIASYIQTRRGFFQSLPKFQPDGAQWYKIQPGYIAADLKTGEKEYVFDTAKGSLHVLQSAFFDTQAEATAKGFKPYFVADSGLCLYASGPIVANGRSGNARFAVVGNGKPELSVPQAPKLPGMTRGRLLAALDTLQDGGESGYFNDELVTLISLVYFVTKTDIDRAWADCSDA